MILVDTSILVDYFRSSTSVASDQFEAILKWKLPFGIDLYIYQELLQGSRSDKDFQTLKKYLDSQKFYGLLHGKESHAKAARLYMKCRKNGITVRGMVDMIIVQTAIENDLLLLHNDRDYTAIAQIETQLKIFDSKFMR